MKRENFIAVAMAVLAVLTTFSALNRQLVSLARGTDLSVKMAGIETFNNISSFVASSDNKRLFRFVETKKGGVYLRFKIRDLDPSGLILRLNLRVPAKAAKSCFARSAVGAGKSGVVVGDKVSFEIDMDPPDQYMWKDGFCYVGVMFAKGALNPGDTVELLDFKFSSR